MRRYSRRKAHRYTLTGAKAAHVAAATIAGQTNAQTATELGLSERQVKNIRTMPETREWIRQLYARNRDQIERLWRKRLASIEARLDQPVIHKVTVLEGDKLVERWEIARNPDTGRPVPNAKVQAAAAAEVLDTFKLVLPREATDAAAGGTTLQLSQLNVLVQQYQAARAEGPPGLEPLPNLAPSLTFPAVPELEDTEPSSIDSEGSLEAAEPAPAPDPEP